jgi:hypothetical protein
MGDNISVMTAILYPITLYLACKYKVRLLSTPDVLGTYLLNGGRGPSMIHNMIPSKLLHGFKRRHLALGLLSFPQAALKSLDPSTQLANLT